jgi:NADH:ubiquinone oxidoreductase subunit 6 (subunit J)
MTGGNLTLYAIGVLLAALGTNLLLPHRRGKARPRRVHVVGALVALGGVALLALGWSPPVDPIARLFFTAFAALSLVAGILTVTARDPVHNALWFAAVLLSTSGLQLLAGAQFLAAGTVIVYAGAIVVTFLFVIMLAQAEGQAIYDRMARAPLVSTVTAFGLMAAVGFAVHRVQFPAGFQETNRGRFELRLPVDKEPDIRRAAALHIRNTTGKTLEQAMAEVKPMTLAQATELAKKGNTPELQASDFDKRLVRGGDLLTRAADPLDPTASAILRHAVGGTNELVIGVRDDARPGTPPPHVAGLGGTMFTDHLISVEIAGAVLFVALVGAAAIATPRPHVRPGSASRTV